MGSRKKKSLFEVMTAAPIVRPPNYSRAEPIVEPLVEEPIPEAPPRAPDPEPEPPAYVAPVPVYVPPVYVAPPPPPAPVIETPPAYEPTPEFESADSADAIEPPHNQPIRAALRDGHLRISLNPLGCVIAAGILCIVTVIAFSAGRRATVHRAPADSLAAVTNPLVPAPQPKTQPQPTRTEQKYSDVDLSRLMRRPDQPPVNETAAPREPARAAAPEDTRAAANRVGSVSRKPLQILHIDSFMLGGHTPRDEVIAEVADARKFLLSKGIPTTCRELSSGFILLSSQGFESPNQADAKAFLRRVQQFGKEFRRAGGRYEFHGCFFRSADALPGTPFD